MIAGLVLAAGAGTRFDPCQSKLLAEWDGRPLLEHAIAAQTSVAALERVVVVLGAHAQEIRSAVRFGRADVVVCDHWMRGRSASLRTGTAALLDAEKVIVTLGDMPLMSASLVSRFVDAPPRARAVYHGAPGHPVVLGSEEVIALQREDREIEARELLAGGTVIECGDSPCSLDVDTRADLQALRRGLLSAAPSASAQK